MKTERKLITEFPGIDHDFRFVIIKGHEITDSMNDIIDYMELNMRRYTMRVSTSS